MVNKIPDDYPRVSYSLSVDGAADAIEFYKSVLGATERMRIPMPDGRIGHSEVQIGDSLLMVADAFPEMNFNSPKTIGGTATACMVYVEDVDATFAAALAAGATQERPVEDMFYGDRTGMFIDPWGHKWSISTHIEDVDPDELARRSDEEMKKMVEGG